MLPPPFLELPGKDRQTQASQHHWARRWEMPSFPEAVSSALRSVALDLVCCKNNLSVHIAQPLSDKPWSSTSISQAPISILQFLMASGPALRRRKTWRLCIFKYLPTARHCRGLCFHRVMEPYHNHRKEGFWSAFYRAVKQKHKVMKCFAHGHKADMKTNIQTQAWLQSSCTSRTYQAALLIDLSERLPTELLCRFPSAAFTPCVWPHLGCHTLVLKIQTSGNNSLRLEMEPRGKGFKLIGLQAGASKEGASDPRSGSSPRPSLQLLPRVQVDHVAS